MGTKFEIVANGAGRTGRRRDLPEPDSQLAPRVLVAVDDDELRSGITEALRQNGFLARATGDPAAAITLNASFTPDVIVVDLRLWTPDGHTLLRSVRSDEDTYLIAVAPVGATARRINALRAGADDVVATTTSPMEVAARCLALLRRPRRRPRTDAGSRAVLALGPLTLDLGRRELRVASNEVAVTRFEFALVELLALHPSEVITRERLLEHASDNRSNADVHVVNVHMSNLRRKLRSAAPGVAFVEAVRGIGFRLAATLTENASPHEVAHAEE